MDQSGFEKQLAKILARPKVEKIINGDGNFLRVNQQGLPTVDINLLGEQLSLRKQIK